MRVILASKSPRRKEILAMITKKFDVIVSDEEEIIDEKLTIERQAESLAYIKAKSVFDQTCPIMIQKLNYIFARKPLISSEI